MQVSAQGLNVTNYTKYFTRDLVAIVNYVEVYREQHCPNNYKPTEIWFDTYNGSFESRTQEKNKYVKLAYSGSCIRIVDPKKLQTSPIEMLVTAESGIFCPQDMVREIHKQVESAFGIWRDDSIIPVTYQVRYGNKVEDKKIPVDRDKVREQRFLKSSGTVKHRLSNMVGELLRLKHEVPWMNQYAGAVLVQENELEEMLHECQVMLDSVYTARECYKDGN